ncbi:MULTISPECIES: helix-turn-helix domain-containing protein [unclassified Brevundimonas]|uniref:helix-turn-helix domain-containing protein n=1 Tax=unclassified Brevundimonas TaxID=2622653 RepID=UPI003916E979
MSIFQNGKVLSNESLERFIPFWNMIWHWCTDINWSESVVRSDSNQRYASLDFGDLRLAWLETFVCVARLRNRSAVGKELGLSQGAVTKHIQSLEGWSRKILVDADSVPATLTDDGLELLEVAQLIIQTLAEVRMSGVAPTSLSYGPVSGDGLKMPDRAGKVGTSTAHLRVPPSVPKSDKD